MKNNASTIFNPFILFIIAVLLYGCGGSGESTETPPPNDPSTTQLISQEPLSFSIEDINIFIDETPPEFSLNGGSGSGAVEYSSSDIQVVDVNSTSGELSVVGEGSATITATKAADDTYNIALAMLTVTISKREQQVLLFQNEDVNIFIDETPPEITLNGGSGSGGVEYSSSDIQVLAVDSTSGELSVVGEGSATITATKAADDTYNLASAMLTVTISKREQQVLLFQYEDFTAYIGTAPSNPLSGGSGKGKLSYSSSDTNVAIINPETGDFTLLMEGEMTIFVTKDGDDIFNQASASFSLVSRYVLSNLEISIGMTDALISWKNQSGIFNVLRTTSESCDMNDFSNCSDSNITIVNDTSELPLLDSSIYINTSRYGNVYSSAYLTFSNETFISEPIDVSPVLPSFGWRPGTKLVSFSDKLWVFGGTDYNANNGTETHWFNDIWSSSDGKTWDLEKENAAFSARAGHKIIEFNNTLYLIGGQEGVGTGGALRFKADVWSSTDGKSWKILTSRAPFDLGDRTSVIEFDNKMWVIGGYIFGSASQSIYSSSNGTTWKKELYAPPFGNRDSPVLYVENNKLWLLGGMSLDENGSIKLNNDIWSSVDGIDWVLEKANSMVTPRMNMQVFHFNKKLWLVGGHDNTSGPTIGNEIYSSTDGINWNLEQSPIIARMNQNVSVALFDEKVWIYSGWTDEYIWHSDDALIWRTYINPELSWNSVSE